MDAFEQACAGWPPEDRTALERVLALALSVVPAADRGVAYGAPALLLRGRGLIGVARSAKHLSLVPYSPAALDTVRADLTGFPTSKGVVRFTAARPVPDPIVARLVRARVAEIEAEPRGPDPERFRHDGATEPSERRR